MASVLLDVAGHRRSPATMPGYHRGRPPRNKGEQYPADPPTVEEIVAVMRIVGDRSDGHRLRALIVLLWRAGLRISEALALQESDLDRSRGAVLVRRGKGGKRREVGMDRWAWEQLDPWLEIRQQLPIGALLCVIHGPTAGRRWEASAARKQLHHAAAEAGVRRRFAPHQLRHAHAVEMAHEGVPLVVIQRQLGHYAGDLVKRAERLGCARLAFQAAMRRPPGVLAMPTWMKAASIRQAFRRIRERLSRSMIAAAASRESRRLVSRRLMIARARRARSTGVSRRSRILGDYFVAGVGIVGLDRLEEMLEVWGEQLWQRDRQRKIELGELEQVIEQLAQLVVGVIAQLAGGVSCLVGEVGAREIVLSGPAALSAAAFDLAI